ncbi:unnamed protein product, partial [Effrenium voratum]
AAGHRRGAALCHGGEGKEHPCPGALQGGAGLRGAVGAGRAAAAGDPEDVGARVL